MHPVKSVHLLLLLTLTLLPLSGCGKNKEELFTEGKNALYKGNPKGAIVFFRNALEKDKNYSDARFELAKALAATGSDDDAERELSRIVAQDPARTDARIELIHVHIRQKKADQAVLEAEELLRKNPGDAKVLETMGIACLAKKMPDAAEKYLLQALTADPARPTVKLELATLNRSRGNIGKARSLAQEVAADNKLDLRATALLAELELQSGNPAKALDIYLKAADANRGAPYPLYKAGQLYLATGARGEALAAADKLVKQFPESSFGYHLHGQILHHDQKYPEAITQLTKALQLQASPEAEYLLGICHYSLKNYDNALAQFRKILAVNPSYVPARLLVAAILLNQKQADAAITEAKGILETAPQLAMAHNILGSAHMMKGESEEGMRELNCALQLDPKIVNVHLEKGLYHARKGNYREAETDLQAALRLAPDVVSTRLLLVSHYVSRGDSGRGLAVLKEALTGKGGDAEIYNNMAAIHAMRTEYDAAHTCLLQAKKADPAYIYSYLNLGIFYSARNEFDKALAEYQAALAAAPQNPLALRAAAEIHELQGRDQEAFDHYRRAANTRDARAYLALAAYQMRSKRPAKEALATLDEAIAAIPKNLDALLVKGQILVSQEKYKQALTVFKSMDEIRPDSGLMMKITTYVRMKEYGTALELARSVITRKPDAAVGYLLTSSVYAQQNDLPKALDELQKGITANPNNLELYSAKGGLLEKRNDVTGAAAAYAEALSRNHDFVPALFSQGALLQKTGDKAGAMRIYRSVMAKTKTHAPAINNLAFLLLDEPAPESVREGVRLAFTAFRLAPENPTVIDTLGYALVKSGQDAEAVKLLEKAAAMAPADREIAGHLELAKKNAAANPAPPAPTVKSITTPVTKGATSSSAGSWLALLGIQAVAGAIIALIAYRVYLKNIRQASRRGRSSTNEKGA